jgi:hypothetical protein
MNISLAPSQRDRGGSLRAALKVVRLVTKPDGRHTTALLELDQKREISKIGGLRVGRPVEMIDMMNS